MERTFCLLIILSLKLFAQDEFIFWAEFSNKNLILSHQNENLSMAMTKSKAKLEEYACELHYTKEEKEKLPKTELGNIDNDMAKSLKFAFLQAHKNELVECFKSSQISVKDYINTQNASASNQTFIKLLPLRFSIDFLDNKAIIYHLKEK